MGLDDYIKKIDVITEKLSATSISDENEDSKSSVFKDYLGLLFTVVIDIVKAPLKLLTNFLKKELIVAIKKDVKLYAVIMGIMGVLFVFFSVMWLFISVAVGAYYYQQGESMLISILYSIIFQFGSIIIVASIAFFASKKIKSLKMLKNLDNINK